MRTRPLDPADLPALHARFCSGVRALPHGLPPTAQEFAEALMRRPATMTGSRVLVADAGSGPLGFAICGRNRVTNRWTLAAEGTGVLLGPFIGTGDATAGEALVAACDEAVFERGARLTHAFDPSSAVALPFYNGGFCGLSERLGDVTTLLARSGFRVRHRELCLTYEGADPRSVAPRPPGLRMESQPPGEGRYALTLYDQDTRAGSCQFSLVAPLRGRNPAGREWGYIDGLGVVDRYQGRGLGRWLMLEAMRQLAEAGCRGVLLTTGSENYRAQNLYYSLGFSLVDSCLCMARPPW